jgi:hypothetical protein
MVFRYKENCGGSIGKKVVFLSKYSLDTNNTIASLFRTQYTPDFVRAENYGLRNTIFWMTKDLAPGPTFFFQTKPLILYNGTVEILVLFLPAILKWR